MKNSLYIFCFFLLGIALGHAKWLPEVLLKTDFSIYALYALVLLVGISMGSELRHSLIMIRTMHLKILLIPFTTVLGTLLGVSLFSLINPSFSWQDSLAIGSGLGYYSLSSIYITEIRGETLGAIALIANLIREVVSLLLIPTFAKYFGKFAPISSAGAASMDTCLPVITHAVGKQYALLAVFHGTILTLLVPILVPFILSL